MGSLLDTPVSYRLYLPPLKQCAQNNCADTAARMINAYRPACVKPPAVTVPLRLDVHLTTPGSLNYFMLNFFAERHGLAFLNHTPLDPSWDCTAAELAQWLQRHGPLWCAGAFGVKGNGHAIVVTGVHGRGRQGSFEFNNPWTGSARTAPLPHFYDNVHKRVAGTIMYKHPSRAPNPDARWA